MRRFGKWMSFLALAAVLYGAGATVQQQSLLAGRLVRLHVVANSNSEQDQQVKLRVRDAVLGEVTELTAGCATRAQAAERLRAGTAQIACAANETLRRAGQPQRATVRLAQEYFPTRVYDTFSLPAGEYTSLRVNIGQAGGRNWWCVVFPTLCAAAQSDELRTVASGAGFSDDQIDLITGEDQRYELKFKFLQLLQRLQSLLRGEP